MTRSIALIVLSLCFAACEKKEEPKPTTAATAAAPTAADPASATEPASASAGDTAELPTEQDFEDEAERTITAENLDSELDKLEKEIGEGT